MTLSGLRAFDYRARTVSTDTLVHLSLSVPNDSLEQLVLLCSAHIVIRADFFSGTTFAASGLEARGNSAVFAERYCQEQFFAS